MHLKRVYLKTFCTFFLIFAIISFAGILEKEVYFNVNDLSFSKIKGYDLVTLKGCKSTVEVGAPLLPRAAFSLLIPQNAEVVNVEVISLENEVISGKYEIYPTQPPRPFIKGTVPPFVEPKKDIYGQDKPYPEKIIESPHTGSMGGYRLASLHIFPLQYIPAEKKLVFYSRIRLRVNYETTAHLLKMKTEKQNKIFKEGVKNLILNPEDIGIFEPPVGFNHSLDLLPDTIEYVIITVDSLASTFQELADWKTKKGVPAKVVTLDSIYDNYMGADNAERIRNFIIDANSSWGTIWVLLGGQCDNEWGQEIVPRRNVYYKLVDGDEYDTIPSDLYFSDLDGDWNADGDWVYGESTDDVDLYSDVFVGRAPVRTVSQTETFVKKILTYEKRPPSGYQKKILLPAAYLWPDEDYDGMITQEAIADMVPGDWQITRMYERYGNLTHTAFVDSVKAGFGFAHLVGHGNQYGVYTYYEDAYFDSDDLDALGNDSLLGVHNSIACLTGALDFVPYGDCFAEHYLTPSTGGGFSIMNSRYGWGMPPEMGPSEHIDTCFYHEIFSENYSYHDHLGVAHALSKDGYVSEATWLSVWAWCIYELNLFGDPQMPLWTDIPQELTANHDPTIPVGTNTFAVNVSSGGSDVEGALVCLYKEGEVYARGYTDAFGDITLNLSPAPASLGTMHCTVTKNNYFPYENSVEVISPSGGWVVFEQYTTIESSGNGDGNVDPGESIELPLTVHNAGLEAAIGVTGTVRTEDSYVTVTDSSENFGDILADSLANSLDAFDFEVSSGCPANHVINFELIAADENDGSWTSYFSVPIFTPDVSLSPDTLNFDTVYIGYPDTLELLVNNNGTDTLKVSSITSDNMDYSVGISNFNILPDENQAVSVIFSPSSEGSSTGNLTIESNDLNEPSLIVTLEGEGLLPPEISVSPDSLSDSLFTGETSIHTLTIRNDGDSDLDFDILIEELDTSITSVDFFVDESVRKHKVMAFGKPVSLNKLKKRGFLPFPQSLEVPGDSIDKGKPFKNKRSNTKNHSLISGEEIFGNDDYEFSGAPRTRGNLFTCEKTTTLIEHRLYINPLYSTQLWFLVYEGESQIGTYNLISASDVTPAGTGLGWYSSGEIDVALEEGKYYLIVASFEELSYYYNQQDISPYPIPASFGELTGGAGWDWVPNTSFPPAATQNVTSDAFADPVAYYQTLVTGRWLDCDSTSGSISAGDSVLIEITFDATGLYGGDYYADIIIASNDPDEPEIFVPAHLHVTGVPDITVSEDTLNYGIVFNGYSSTDTLIVSNEGTDSLNVNDISSDNPDYTVDITNFSLSPGENQEVVVTFTPSSVGTITGNLTISSDDPDESALSVFLEGECLEPPDISVSPDSLSDSLFTGEISVDTLTIYNKGLSDLLFDISFKGGLAGSLLSLQKSISTEKKIQTSLTEIKKGEEDTREYPPMVIGKGGPDAFGYRWKDSNEPDGPSFNWIDVSGGTSISLTDDDFEIGIPLGFTFNYYGMDFTTIGVGSNGWLSFNGFNDWFPSNVPYADSYDGAIAPFARDLYPPSASYIRYQTFGTAPNRYFVVEYNNIPNCCPSGDYKTFEVIFYENSNKIKFQYLTAPDDNPFGFGIESPDETMGMGNAGMDSLFIIPTVVENNYAIEFSLTPDWISTDPVSGIIPAGDSAKVEVTFDATNLNGGDYYTDILINSNDPDQPEDTVPVHLHVTGVPDIAVSDDTLDYGIVYPGFSITDTLIVINAGTDTLTVSGISSDNGDYTIDTTNFILGPAENQEVLVTFSPSTTGTITGTLSVESNDPDESTVTVFLRGECLEPPDISVAPDSLSDTLNQGQTAIHTLTIYNTGVDDLVFDISTETLLNIIAAAKDNSPESKLSSDIKKVINSLKKRYTSNKTTLDEVGNLPGDEINFDTPGPLDLGDVINSFPAPTEAFGLEWVDGYLWATSSGYGILYKIDPTDGTVLKEIDYSGYYSGLAWDGNAFWVTDAAYDVIDKIDTLGDVIFSFDAPSTGSVGLTWDGTYLWDVDFNDNQLHKIDPADGSVLTTLPSPDPRPAGVAWDGRYLWTNGRDNATTYKINPDDGTVVNSFATPPAPGTNNGQGAAFDGQYLWILNSDNEMIYQIDVEFEAIWLTIDPTSDTVPASDSVQIEVTFDATNLEAGDYYADITIASNDPDEPELIVPAYLHVSSAGIEEKQIPKIFFVKQNYPNPFNNQTVIKYGCPKKAKVCIQVFDCLGRIVHTLIDKEVEPGYHQITWDGSNKFGKKLSNSVYFYRIQAGDFMATKKMIFIR
jgi:hypothetical protein